MRVAIVQFAPKLGDVQSNISKATKLCAKLKPGSIDLLCLPEMIFSGYMFEDGPSILPYLERPTEGPTFQFCSSLATRLGCFVAAGFPEVLDEEERNHSILHQVGANSAMIVAPDGKWFSGYRKTNLFETDKSWAKAGTGFLCVDLPPPLGLRVSLGICMDLNTAPPHSWTSLEDGPYELAQFARDNNSDILVILCAWLMSDKEPHKDVLFDEQTAMYWCQRLRPLWVGDERELDNGKEVTVVLCNRSGQEKDTLFAGSSAIFKMSRAVGHPQVIGLMSRIAEETRVFTV